MPAPYFFRCLPRILLLMILFLALNPSAAKVNTPMNLCEGSMDQKIVQSYRKEYCTEEERTSPECAGPIMCWFDLKESIQKALRRCLSTTERHMFAESTRQQDPICVQKLKRRAALFESYRDGFMEGYYPKYTSAGERNSSTTPSGPNSAPCSERTQRSGGRIFFGAESPCTYEENELNAIEKIKQNAFAMGKAIGKNFSHPKNNLTPPSSSKKEPNHQSKSGAAR